MRDGILVDPCPDCDEEEQEVLRDTPQNRTLRCTGCGTVRSMAPTKQATIIELNAVISHDETSRRTTIPTPADEEIAAGFEFGLDDHRMIVTSIEVEGQQNPPKALAKDIKTLFAKVFDTVPLKLSVNQGDVTRSFRVDVDPDMEVPIGLVVDAGSALWAIKTLKSDQNRTLHKGFLLARNVRRAFCDPAPRRAKPGDVVAPRKRGAPVGSKPGGKPAPRVKGPRGQGRRSTKR